MQNTGPIILIAIAVMLSGFVDLLQNEETGQLQQQVKQLQEEKQQCVIK